VMGIEALSRGAACVDFVEANGKRALRLRENLRSLTLSDRGNVYQAKVDKALDVLPGRYALVFADPPYEMRDWGPLMSRLSEGELLAMGATIVVEHRFDTELADRYAHLARDDRRRYGDTAVSFYRAVSEDG